MEITDSSPERIKAAVEYLIEGGSISYHGVSFRLERTGNRPQLIVSSWSDCIYLDNVRKEEAQEKVQRSQQVVEDLANRSPEFRSLWRSASPRYRFCFDYGTAGLLLAEESGGQIIWKGK